MDDALGGNTKNGLASPDLPSWKMQEMIQQAVIGLFRFSGLPENAPLMEIDADLFSVIESYMQFSKMSVAMLSSIIIFDYSFTAVAL